MIICWYLCTVTKSWLIDCQSPYKIGTNLSGDLRIDYECPESVETILRVFAHVNTAGKRPVLANE